MLADGRVLIAGNTVCDDYNQPTRYFGKGGFFQGLGGGSDAFVAILSADLKLVDRWTYLPGTGNERAYLAVEDNQGNIWVTGFTSSGSGFTFGNTLLGGGPGGGWDVYVAKFDSTLNTKLWAVRIGGSGEDNPRASMVVVDEGSSPVAYVSGHTASTNFPITTGSPDPDGCVWDAFIVKINSSGGLVWSRLFGGTDHEDAYANIRVHPGDGSIYVGGFTRSGDLNTQYPGLPGFNKQHNGQTQNCTPCGSTIVGCTSGDGFVARFDTNGALMAWTYLGGTDDDTVTGNDGLELVPGTNQVVVAGNTKSASWPAIPVGTLTLDPSYNGATDAYLAILSDDLASLQFHTFFGGDGPEEPSGLATDDVGNIYFGGNTCSSQSGAIPFPLTGNAYDPTYGGDGNGDAFIAKLNVNFAGPNATLNYSTYFGGGVLNDLNGWTSCPTNCTTNPTDPKVCPGYEGDRVRSLMLMPNGKVLCCGDTDSTDFPTYPKSGPNAVEDPNFVGGDSDAFVAIHNVN